MSIQSKWVSATQIKTHLAQRTRPLSPKRLIGFTLFQERFALEMRGLKRVIPWENLQFDQRGIIACTESLEILVLDLQHHIFQDQRDLIKDLKPNPQNLVVMATVTGGLIGLPIHSEPTILRVSLNQIRDLPTHYHQARDLRYVKGVLFPDSAPHILLDLDVLLREISHQNYP